MRRAWRMAAVGGSVIAVGAIALALRTLNTAGVFSDVSPGFAGTCRTIGGLNSGEDIAIAPQAGIAFISAADRRARSARDGLYLLQLAHPELGVTRIDGTPKNFHPHGISLHRGGDGSLTLMAVNYLLDGDAAVDIFDVTVSKGADGLPVVALSERSSVRSSLFHNPDDVAAVGKNSFYVTDDHDGGASFWRLFEGYLVGPRSNVIYYNGVAPRVVATGLRQANGVGLSPDGSKLYVAETAGRELRTYDVQPVSGSLSLVNEYPLPAGLDNIDVDSDGNLWVAGHPKFFAFARYARNPSQPSPSEVFKVTTANGIPDGFTVVYAGLGHRIGAASVGVYAGGRLLIGSVFDTKILDCTLR